MTDFLLDTLLWTGALIVLVLLLRRPVALHFGAGAAYALWALPVLRMVMPPLILPAWMKAEAPIETASASEPVTASLASVDPMPVTQAVAATPQALPSPIDFVGPLLVLWLAGSGIFLVRRFSLYFAMRRDLLDGSRSVGEVGDIRMVESPEADGPVAFGIIDKVVALPWDFMATRDRQTRDLAIAHELAHHRGGDLLVNFLVQPLFALHWFNPLGWMGWRAMRRDQEAACDARVVQARPREQRASYANLIADFATAAKTESRLALAAPMACPVLGDKSIIHRLRSLSMPDPSTSRRIAGRALLIGASLALPMTATISYAEDRTQNGEVEGRYTHTAAQEQDEQREEVIEAEIERVEEIQEDAFEEAFAQEAQMDRELELAERELERAEEEIEREVRRVVQVTRNAERDAVGNGRTLIEAEGDGWTIRDDDGWIVENGERRRMTAEERARFEAQMERHRANMERHRKDMEGLRANMEHHREAMEAHRESLEELQRRFGKNSEFHKEMEELREDLKKQREHQKLLRMRVSKNVDHPIVSASCDARQTSLRVVSVSDGLKFFVCTEGDKEQAATALANARASIAASTRLTKPKRTLALAQLAELSETR